MTTATTPASGKEPKMPTPDTPIWIVVVVGVLLPVLGWASKAWADRMRQKVEEHMNFNSAQQQFSDALASRVKELEDRMERMSENHKREVQEIRDSYQAQIRSIREHYEARIQHLERLAAGYEEGTDE